VTVTVGTKAATTRVDRTMFIVPFFFRLKILSHVRRQQPEG
jgi:hypothetical protein